MVLRSNWRLDVPQHVRCSPCDDQHFRVVCFTSVGASRGSSLEKRGLGTVADLVKFWKDDRVACVWSDALDDIGRIHVPICSFSIIPRSYLGNLNQFFRPAVGVFFEWKKHPHPHRSYLFITSFRSANVWEVLALVVFHHCWKSVQQGLHNYCCLHPSDCILTLLGPFPYFGDQHLLVHVFFPLGNFQQLLQYQPRGGYTCWHHQPLPTTSPEMPTQLTMSGSTWETSIKMPRPFGSSNWCGSSAPCVFLRQCFG